MTAQTSSHLVHLHLRLRSSTIDRTSTPCPSSDERMSSLVTQGAATGVQSRECNGKLEQDAIEIQAAQWGSQEMGIHVLRYGGKGLVHRMPMRMMQQKISMHSLLSYYLVPNLQHDLLQGQMPKNSILFNVLSICNPYNFASAHKANVL